ncbi:hypothetical protein JTB14_034999 [Gonioctena quinquepunctata]|nr:hypothetical protein JTB14_034999 [Gonioctena quinquepunctata]
MLENGRGIAVNIENTKIKKLKQSINHFDFNCILTDADSTSSNESQALLNTVNGLKLADIWKVKNKNEGGYTYHYPGGETRLHRIYVSANLIEIISSVCIHPTTISDHSAYVFKIKMKFVATLRGRGYWELNVSNLGDENFV